MPRGRPKEKEVKSEIVEKPQEAALLPIDVQIVAPAATPAQLVQSFKTYQKICEELLEKTDYQVIHTYQAGKGMVARPFKKKSAWRKLATAYNFSDEIVSEIRKEYNVGQPNYYFVIEVTAKAVAKNGRFSTGVGSCASNERGFAHLEHDVRSTAHTRAKNRAISDLIGTGEVSAEEMEQSKKRATEECDVDHATLTPLETKKPGKNFGRKYIRCERCDFWKWVDETKVKTDEVDIKTDKETQEKQGSEVDPASMF